MPRRAVLGIDPAPGTGVLPARCWAPIADKR